MITRYVDLYMGNVCDLLNYSPSHRFFPSHPIRMVRTYMNIYVGIDVSVLYYNSIPFVL